VCTVMVYSKNSGKTVTDLPIFYCLTGLMDSSIMKVHIFND
jgi:hypothetical protein